MFPFQKKQILFRLMILISQCYGFIKLIEFRFIFFSYDCNQFYSRKYWILDLSSGITAIAFPGLRGLQNIKSVWPCLCSQASVGLRYSQAVLSEILSSSTHYLHANICKYSVCICKYIHTYTEKILNQEYFKIICASIFIVS